MKTKPYKPQPGFLKKHILMPAFLLSMMAMIAIISLSSFNKAQEIPDADTLETEEAIPDSVPDSALMKEETTEEVIADAEPAFTRGEYTSQQIRRGERLFSGLVPFRSGQHDCASCHYLQPQNEINWNPAAYEMAALWSQNPDYSIMNVMNNPVSMRLMEDHAGMTITREEEHLLEAYYTKILKQGPGELTAYPVRAFIFWGLGALMLLALVDLIITRKIKFKGIHILVLLAGIAVHGQFAMAEAQNLGRTKGYAPDQPIKFSHLIHAGENETDCRYCHYIADYSLSAGIPSNNVCLNCHNVVRSGTLSGSFEINKIHRAAETGEPIEWIRVHKLPDHSFFSHAQHVNAGKRECVDCHGEVETMHIVQQVEELSMGWCLTCHRDENVDFLDNPYFEIYEKLHEKIRNGEIDAVTAADLGGEDCMSCHY
ncbi:MAG: cytochrome c family protein [Bacteroidales bacterium]|nr:cytochrome c family protein [Bacteroidales bacterium]